MATLNSSFIRSLVSMYSAEVLKAKWEEATRELEDNMSEGQVVTGANMKESWTSFEVRQGQLDRKVRSYEAAYHERVRLEAGGAGAGGSEVRRPNRSVNHISLAGRIWGS